MSNRRGFLCHALPFGAFLLAFAVAPVCAQTVANTLRELAYPYGSLPSGIYSVDENYTFNVLDDVYYDAKTEQLALEGHFDRHYLGSHVSYLQNLFVLLQNDQPEFSLSWTPESSAEVDGLLHRQLTGEEVDRIAAAYKNLFDADGKVTALGGIILSNFGLSPIAAHRPPGFLGAEVIPNGGGTVRVIGVSNGSPAEGAGLLAGDVIETVNGSPPLYPSEFLRIVRFSGAGSILAVAYVRGGEQRRASTSLVPDSDQSVWDNATRYDAFAALLRQANEQQMAQASYALGVFNNLYGTRSAGDALHQFFNALGAGDVYVRLVGAGGAPSRELQLASARELCTQMDRVFKLSGQPTANAFEASISGGADVSQGIVAAFTAFDRADVENSKKYLDPVFLRPGGVQVPPEIVDSVLHVRPVMTPTYIGMTSDTLLARAMFDGDYLAKRLTNNPQLGTSIPGYMTQYQFERTHAAFARTQATYRLWISVANIDLAQSPDGKTLAFANVAMRFNERETSNGVELPEQAGSYAALLTSLYPEFETRYPALHELREAAKIAAAAAWIRRRSPGLRLPSNGLVHWTAPQTVPGLLYQYLSSPDASYQNATSMWIAEGGVSLGSNPQPALIDAGLDATPVVPAFYDGGALERIVHKQIDVPDPLFWVQPGQKGVRTTERVTLMLRQMGSADPQCLEANQELQEVGELASRLTTTERATHMLSERGARRTAEWNALTADLIRQRERFTENTVEALSEAGGDIRHELETDAVWPTPTQDTRSILKFFDRINSIRDSAEVDSNGAVNASYSWGTFKALKNATVEYIEQAGNPVTGAPPSLRLTLKPFVKSVGQAQIFANIFLNEWALGELGFLEIKVNEQASMQSADLETLKQQLLPLSKALSDEIDTKLRDVQTKTESGNCRRNPPG